jgi:hypothetical protein
MFSLFFINTNRHNQTFLLVQASLKNSRKGTKLSFVFLTTKDDWDDGEQNIYSSCYNIAVDVILTQILAKKGIKQQFGEVAVAAMFKEINSIIDCTNFFYDFYL